MKKIIVLLRHSPFQTMRHFEALRMSVGLTMSDNPKEIVFVDDGVYLLSPRVDPARLSGFDPYTHLEMLHDMECPFVAEKESLEARGIETLRYPAEVRSRAEIARMLAEGNVVITY